MSLGPGLPCPAPHGGECSTLRLESRLKGASGETAPGPAQDPRPGVAGPHWPKGCSTAFKTQPQRCTTFPGMPRTGGSRNTALPGAFAAAAPSPHSPIDRPTDRRNNLHAPARTASPPRHPLRAGATATRARQERACAAAAASWPRPSPRKRGFEAPGPVRRGRARGVLFARFLSCCPRGSGFCFSRLSDAGVEEGEERERRSPSRLPPSFAPAPGPGS